MTDNGSCYLSRAFDQACNKLGLKHIKTKPYRAQNQRQGRALHPEASLREWAYARAYDLRLRRTHSRGCLDGFIATISADPMAASAPNRPSAASALNRNNQ